MIMFNGLKRHDRQDKCKTHFLIKTFNIHANFIFSLMDKRIYNNNSGLYNSSFIYINMLQCELCTFKICTFCIIHIFFKFSILDPHIDIYLH